MALGEGLAVVSGNISPFENIFLNSHPLQNNKYSINGITHNSRIGEVDGRAIEVQKDKPRGREEFQNYRETGNLQMMNYPGLKRGETPSCVFVSKGKMHPKKGVSTLLQRL